MAFSFSSILPGLFGTANAAADTALADKLAAYNTIAQTALKSAITTVDGSIDKLQTAYTTYSSANPVVSEALGEFQSLASDLGVYVPPLSVIETHVKAAVADLIGTFVQPAATSGTTTSAPTT